MRSRCSDEEMSRICCIDVADVTEPRVVADWPVRGAFHMHCSQAGSATALQVWSMQDGNTAVAATCYSLEDLGLCRWSAGCGALGCGTAATEGAVTQPCGERPAEQLPEHACEPPAGTECGWKDDVACSSGGRMRQQGIEGGTLSLRAATRRAQPMEGGVGEAAPVEDPGAADAADGKQLAYLLGISDGGASPRSSAEHGARGSSPVPAGDTPARTNTSSGHGGAGAGPGVVAAPEATAAEAAASDAGSSGAGDAISWDAFRSVREQLEAMCHGDGVGAADSAAAAISPVSGGPAEPSPAAAVAGHQDGTGLNTPDSGLPARASEGGSPGAAWLPSGGMPTAVAATVRSAGRAGSDRSIGSASLCNSSLFIEAGGADAHGDAASDLLTCSQPAACRADSPPTETGLQLERWLAHAQEATAAVQRAATAEDRTAAPFSLPQLCAAVGKQQSPGGEVAPQHSSGGGVAWSIGETPQASVPSDARVCGRSPGHVEHAAPARPAEPVCMSTCGAPPADAEQRQRRPTSQALLRRLLRKKPTVRQILGKDPPQPPPGRRLPVRCVP